MKIEAIVLKIASRCNLNCSYCYMYNAGDLSYKNQPKFINVKMIDVLFERIKNHCVLHSLKQFSIILHGGEPLLADISLYKYLIEKGKKIENDEIKIDYVIQTNGVLVNEEWVDFFLEYKIGLGFSLDGTKETHDKYRVYHNGKGSYTDVIAGMNLYKSKSCNLPIITVIDIDSNPIELYENYKKLGVTHWHTLMPDCTHESKPEWLKEGNTLISDWFINLYDYWINDKSEDKIQNIHTFQQLSNLIFGTGVGDDHIGNHYNNVIVIETNGGIETSDPLKICGDSFTKAGMDIYKNSFDEALQTPLANIQYNAHHELCYQCSICPIKNVCGGGYLAHRYKHDNGFDNPTVYCKDHIKLISHLQNDLFKRLPEHILAELGVTAMAENEILDSIDIQLNQVSDELRINKKLSNFAFA
jgi:uncharacterized protein